MLFEVSSNGEPDEVIPQVRFWEGGKCSLSGCAHPPTRHVNIFEATKRVGFRQLLNDYINFRIADYLGLHYASVSRIIKSYEKKKQTDMK